MAYVLFFGALYSPPQFLLFPSSLSCLQNKDVPKSSRHIVSMLSHFSCVQLCDYSPPGSSAHGILQARILEWVAMPSFRGSSWPRDWTCIFCNSCIVRRILYCWATREAPRCIRSSQNIKIILNSTITLEWTNSTHYSVIWNCQYVKWKGQC